MYFVLAHYGWFVGALVCSVYLYYKDLTIKQTDVNAICQMHKVKSYLKKKYWCVCVCVDLFHISLLLQLQKDQQANQKLLQINNVSFQFEIGNTNKTKLKREKSKEREREKNGNSRKFIDQRKYKCILAS